MGSSISATSKRHILACKHIIWHIDCQNRCDLCTWLRNQKRKQKNPNTKQTWYSPRPPMSSDPDIVCHIVCGLWMIVLSFKFHKNRLRFYRDVRVIIWLIALLWPVAYTALYYQIGVNDNISETWRSRKWHLANIDSWCTGIMQSMIRHLWEWSVTT